MQIKTDITIIGGGIVGLSTARALVEAGLRKVLVLEAEPRVAAHQTGHNSGGIHSGLYYKPGSLKARYCVAGREALYRFCLDYGIPHERCGKLVVATTESERAQLRMLEQRGQANGLIGIRRLDPVAMREREPEVAGVEGLLVPDTGIVDFKAVCATHCDWLTGRDVPVHTQAAVETITPVADGFVLQTAAGEVHTGHLINCAGLNADRIARMAGCRPAVRMVPFRGSYVKLRPAAEKRVAHLIYPVPDPRFPFLGVHFTRMIGGGVEAGPNAVLTFRRQWYAPGDDPRRDFSVLGYPGFWRMGLRYGSMAWAEWWRSRSRTRMVQALQRLVPAIQADDIEPHGSGIRAQAVSRDGRLVDDFQLIEAPRQLHVLNAPSPAATASLRIGEEIAARARAVFDR